MNTYYVPTNKLDTGRTELNANVIPTFKLLTGCMGTVKVSYQMQRFERSAHHIEWGLSEGSGKPLDGGSCQKTSQGEHGGMETIESWYQKRPARTSTPIPHFQMSILRSGLGVLTCQSAHIIFNGRMGPVHRKQTEEVPAGYIFVKLK